MKRLLLPPLLFAMFLCSCGRISCVTYPALFVKFSGYEADSGVMIILSQPGLSTAGDTFYITSNEAYHFEPDYNTGGQRLSGRRIGLLEGYDCQIYVPSTGKRDVISGITYTHDDRKSQGFAEGGGHGNECDNVCTGYNLNGVHHNTGLTAAVTYPAFYDSEVTISK